MRRGQQRRTGRGTLRRAVLASAALAALLGGVSGAAVLLPAGTALAGDEDEPKKPEKSVDADAVVYGDARNWSKPAEVDMDAVYREISEYKEILDNKLEPSDPKYGILLTKARKRFRAAVCDAAKDGGYDLVAKVGAVKGVENVPVITQAVIKKL